MARSNVKLDVKKMVTNFDALLIISLGILLVAILSPNFVHAETSSVKVGENFFDVEYVGNGVSVNGIESDLDFISLIFSVDVSSPQGVLDVTFDRSFFDSVYNGNDDDFIVLADGDEPTYSEVETTDSYRTLRIILPTGTEEVEIIGSVFGSPSEPPVIEEPEVPEEPEVIEKPTVPEVIEKPKPETSQPETTKPKVECGSGTILKDGVCVLDERCGPGTVLENGVCVVKSESAPVGSLGKQLVYGVIAAFVIAGIIGIILALMSKASKSS